MPPSLPGGFDEDGLRYRLRDPLALQQADADLWNDRMLVRIDQRGRCNAFFLQPNATRYCDGDFRAFYIRDDDRGACFSVPHEPIHGEFDAFEFSVGRADVAWQIRRDSLEIALELVVPRRDPLELWTVTVTNAGRSRRRVSLLPCMPIGRCGYLQDRAWYDEQLQGIIHDYFPYYVEIPDYYKLRALRNQVFLAADRRPTAWETLASRFLGRGAWHKPDQLAQKILRRPAPGEVGLGPTAAVLQFRRTLAPGQSLTVKFAFGPARDRAEVLRLKRRYLGRGGIEHARAEAARFIDRHQPAIEIETPDRAFDHYVNHWLPARMIQIGRTLRFNLSPQGRNVIQDAMGATLVDPAQARHWFERIWSHQHTNGFLPHGMPFAEGVDIMPITRIPHKDTNVWGPIALRFYLAETGDVDLLEHPVPFADESREAPLDEHIDRGLRFLLRDRTRRGLCRLGQGDWNDPLNMAGMHEKGESIWLTEALAFALEQWAQVATQVGDTKRAQRYRRDAAAGRAAVARHAWAGQWFARGTRDDGRWFGTPRDRYGRIYLNPQSWAIISGLADDDQIAQCARSVEKHLMTPCGPMTLAPAFPAMDESIGKITQKVPGTGENGSVYCHAATFWSYALFLAGRDAEGFKVLRALLPGEQLNPPRRCGQLPLYVPNFYTGAPLGQDAGLSSHSPTTGTVAWYYRTVVEMLFGLQPQFDGLRIQPHLPPTWRRARAVRRFRNAVYEVEYRRAAKLKAPVVRCDGAEVADGLLPLPRRGVRHEVEVLLPSH